VVDNLPEQNFLAWHYSQGIGQLVKDRLNQFSSIWQIFNVAGLLKNFFAPYRRLAVTGKSEKFGARDLFDKLTFNAISTLIGVFVRSLLILAWIFATILYAFLFIPLILLWIVIPLISLPKYLKINNTFFYENDLLQNSLFLKKLYTNSFFKYLSLFFETDFVEIFKTLPTPKNLGLEVGEKAPQIILKLLKNWPALKNYLAQKNIKDEEFKLLVETLAIDLETPKTASTPVGQMLAYGYTNTLDRFAQEIVSTRLASPSKVQLLSQIEKTLTRPQNNNILLAGEPGVGRHNTISEISAAIRRLQLPTLSGRRIMLLDTIALAASGKDLVGAKQSFEAVFAEAKSAGNIILVIDHIDKIASPKDERIDLTDVLTTVLTDNSLPIIGITTPDDFAKYIRPNSNFLKLFEKIDLDQASPDETINVLIGKAIEAYQKEKVDTYFSALLEIVKKSGRLVQDRKQPEKSILLFQDAIAEALSASPGSAGRREKVIDIDLVDRLISQKTKTPVGKITGSEVEKLKSLETILHKRIIGQDEAIVEIAKAMRRARAEIENSNRPIGSFLFLGPTGVGKTETAKALAQAYFGAEDRMVRFDMSEFQDTNGLKRLIGDPENQSPGFLATKIRENPYGLLLVDEFEKADPAVHNLFLQILDEGFMTDAFGKKVNFDNVIIIATSNAGAEFIREQINSSRFTVDSSQNEKNVASVNREPLTKNLIEYVLQKGLFSPELINRFDGVIVYHPLTDNQTIAVADLMLKHLAQNLKETKNIQLELSGQLAQAVAQKGFDPTFGARPMRRLIADKIEDGIAKMIIEEKIKNGDTISVETLLKFVS